VFEENSSCDHVDRVFERLDLNNDGIITVEEFLDSCMKDETISRSLSVFNTIIWCNIFTKECEMKINYCTTILHDLWITSIHINFLYIVDWN